MKVAVLFFGIHYKENFSHWMGWKTNVDFRKSVENYKEHIFGFYHETDTFLSSYHSEKETELLEAYHPIKYSFATLDHKRTNIEQRNERFGEVISMAGDDYDLYLITRFDLFFLMKFDKLKISFDKINLSYKTGCGADRSLVDDNFYIIPKQKMPLFKEILAKTPKTQWYHDLNKYVNESELNFMVDGFFYSHESPLYRFLR